MRQCRRPPSPCRAMPPPRPPLADHRAVHRACAGPRSAVARPRRASWPPRHACARSPPSRRAAPARRRRRPSAPRPREARWTAAAPVLPACHAWQGAIKGRRKEREKKNKEAANSYGRRRSLAASPPAPPRSRAWQPGRCAWPPRRRAALTPGRPAEQERFPCDFAKWPLLFLEIKRMILCIGIFAS